MPPGYESVRVLGPDEFGEVVLPRITPRARRAIRGSVVAVCAAAMGVAGVWGADLAFEATPERLQVKSIRLLTDPAPARVECPRAEVRLRAVFGTNGVAGALAVRWSWPREKLVAEDDLTVPAGQRRVVARLSLPLRGSRPLRGPATVTLVDRYLSASRFVVYRCPT